MLSHKNLIKYLLTRKTQTNKYITKKYLNYQIYLEKTQNNLIEKQTGGGTGKPAFIVNYQNHAYEFYEDVVDENFFILYSMDKKSKCIVIQFDKEEKTATIQNIEANKSCVLDNHKIGSTLLQIALKLLLGGKFTKKYNIDKVVLTDDSEKYCKAIGESIDMKIMSVLTTGETWYGRYGFRPVKIKGSQVILNEEFNAKYNENIKLMNKLTISDIPLINYFTNCKTIKPEQLFAIKKIILKNPQILLKDFLNKMLKDFDSTCELFSQFYIELFENIGLKQTGTFYGYFLK